MRLIRGCLKRRALGVPSYSIMPSIRPDFCFGIVLKLWATTIWFIMVHLRNSLRPLFLSKDQLSFSAFWDFPEITLFHCFRWTSLTGHFLREQCFLHNCYHLSGCLVAWLSMALVGNSFHGLIMQYKPRTLVYVTLCALYVVFIVIVKAKRQELNFCRRALGCFT